MDLRATTSSRLIGPVRDDLEAARQDALRGIANTGAGRQLLQELVKPDAFSPVGKPDVIARLYRRPDGLYLGHARAANGQIVGNAQWVKISTLGSRLLTSTGMLTGHLMLVEMSNKLDRVQAGVDSIRAALEDDRMESLRAAIDGLKNAVEATSPDNRNALMRATIPGLQKAVYQMIAALRREISEVPSPNEWRVTDVVKDKQPQMRLKLGQAEMTFRACLEGISVLSQAYIALNEVEIGFKTSQNLIRKLQDAGTKEAENKARRLMPKNDDERPEKLWTDFNHTAPELIEMFEMQPEQKLLETTELNIELLSTEIVAALNGYPETTPAGGLQSREDPSGVGEVI